MTARWSEPVGFSLGEKNVKPWVFGFLVIWIHRYRSVLQRYSQESSLWLERCTECVLWPKFVRRYLWGLWAGITGEEQVSSLAHCFYHQEVGWWFLSDTYIVPLHFSRFFSFSDVAGKYNLYSVSATEPLPLCFCRCSRVAGFFIHLVWKVDFWRWLQNSIQHSL